MKALVLGGFGIMGSSVARDLIKSQIITQVVLAGRRIHMDNMHSAVQASGKVASMTLDVTDFRNLVAAMKKNDIVINCSGPFFKLGLNTMKAAIEAGTNYVDICDDYEAVQEAFTLDRAAKEAGISICVGFGGGPGVTNIIAKYAAEKLDEVEEIRILWIVGLNDPSGTAALSHGFHMLEGNVPQFIEGKWVEVPGFSGAEEVEFLEPVGKCEVYYVGHPEPITLPRYIKSVKTVTCKGGFAPSWVNQMISDLPKYGLVTPEPIKVDGGSITPLEFFTKIMTESPTFKKRIERYDQSPANIVVKGKEGGKDVTYVYRLTGKVAPGTGIAASIAAQMICSGEVREKGVIAPEGAVDPVKFFAEFAKKGFRLSEQKAVTSEVQF